MGSIHHNICSDIRECVVLGAIALLLVLASPFLAFILFTTRPFLIVVGLVALVAIISPLVIVPRLRGRWQADVAPESAYRGLRLARDVALHPGHTWAWIGQEEIIVGADDLAQAELGPIDRVDLPAEGSRVHRDETLFRIRRGSRTIELPAPVSGTIVRLNEQLRDQPDLINRRPFSQGWVARIHADEHLVDDRRHLRSGRSAWRWFRAEVDDLLSALPESRADTEESSDGLAERLYTAIDDATWMHLRTPGATLAAG